jgi:hypothetical protein
VTEPTTDWYISRTHSVKALGHLTADLAEQGYLQDDFEMPLMLDLWEKALIATVEDGRSPLDERHFR